MRKPLKQLQATLRREWLVVLDFDRTLFDTARFYRDFLEAIKITWGTELAATLQAVERTGEHLDPFEHLSQAHAIDYEAVVKSFDSYVAKHYPHGVSYLFEGATEMIQFLEARPRTHLLIMTTGTELSQTFKLKLCPELAHLKSQIIPDNKGQLLQDKFTQAGGIAINGHYFSRFVLIDDKAAAITPLASDRRHILVHLLRGNAKFQDRTGRDDVIEVSNFRQIIDLLS